MLEKAYRTARAALLRERVGGQLLPHPSEQPFAHADGEGLNADAAQLGDGKVAELVHQHHDAQNDEEINSDDQEMRNVQRTPRVNGL